MLMWKLYEWLVNLRHPACHKNAMFLILNRDWCHSHQEVFSAVFVGKGGVLNVGNQWDLTGRNAGGLDN